MELSKENLAGNPSFIVSWHRHQKYECLPRVAKPADLYLLPPVFTERENTAQRNLVSASQTAAKSWTGNGHLGGGALRIISSHIPVESNDLAGAKEMLKGNYYLHKQVGKQVLFSWTTAYNNRVMDSWQETEQEKRVWQEVRKLIKRALH